LTRARTTAKIPGFIAEEDMLKCRTCTAIALLVASFAAAHAQAGKNNPSAKAPAPSDPTAALLESKIKAEWEAVKNKDKKALGDLLADDFQGVEVDGQGERTRTQAMNELANGNVINYTLWGFRVTPLGPDASFVIYEVTMQFPPKSVVRFSRVYVSELWVKRNGQWKELHYQETHVK
jgi:hypothetical protein